MAAATENAKYSTFVFRMKMEQQIRYSKNRAEAAEVIYVSILPFIPSITICSIAYIALHYIVSIIVMNYVLRLFLTSQLGSE
jgi:hypothetical protein